MTGRSDTSSTLLWVLVGVVAFAAVTSILGGLAGWRPWGWGMTGFMWIWMLVPVLLVVWLISALVNPGRPASHQVDAVEIAERRYAAGEISRDEFERIRGDLAKRP